MASLQDFLPTFVTLEHTVQVPESLQVGAEVMNMKPLLHPHVTPLVQIHLVEADGRFDYHRASGKLGYKKGRNGDEIFTLVVIVSVFVQVFSPEPLSRNNF